MMHETTTETHRTLIGPHAMDEKRTPTLASPPDSRTPPTASGRRSKIIGTERAGSEPINASALSKALKEFEDSGSARQRTPGASPSRKRQRVYGDRFIPNREGQDLQASFNLMHEDGSPSTPSKAKKRTPHGELHFQRSRSYFEIRSCDRCWAPANVKQLRRQIAPIQPCFEPSFSTTLFHNRHRRVRLQMSPLTMLQHRMILPDRGRRLHTCHHQYCLLRVSPHRPLIKTFSHICPRDITRIFQAIPHHHEHPKVGMGPISIPCPISTASHPYGTTARSSSQVLERPLERSAKFHSRSLMHQI